jgi:hypothetical protein
MSIPASLPALFAGWTDDIFGGQIPNESSATCESCAMVVDDDPHGERGFSAATKCCTFVPDLWNFLAGAVLLDDDPAMAKGRASVDARIARGVGVTPLGLRRNPAYQLVYDGAHDSFGHSKAMLCPHYLPENGGLCGVWRHRESTCTTWFCKFTRGAVGREFWLQYQQLLRHVEESLVAWSLLELGLDAKSLAHLFHPMRIRTTSKVSARDVDDEVDPRLIDLAWGTWRGREHELYIACARLVAPLSWADVERIGGAQLAVYERLARDAYAQLTSDDVPAKPTRALVQITPRADGRVRLATYSKTDELDVPSVVMNVLPYFDGRPLDETLAAIRRAERMEVDPSLVRKLTDFGVLRES